MTAIDHSVWTEIITAPRWGQLPKAFRNMCWERGLSLEIEVDQGWIMETIRIRVSGPEAKVSRFKNAFYAVVGEWEEMKVN